MTKSRRLLRKTIVLVIVGLFIVFVLFQYFYGGTPSDVVPKSGFEILAHRGAHVNWKKGTYDRMTGCEATHIYEPTHGYIENTIEAIKAAFEMGATIVEIDIRRSGDDHLMIFHDEMLECRTDGHGKVGDHPLEYLKSLDIGYGYTYDNGTTFPFRGKGVGKMPTLVEVLQEFPDKKFLIDQKGGSPKTTECLVEVIRSLPLAQQRLLYYWGNDANYAYINNEIPSVTRFFGTPPQIKKWLLRYTLTSGLSGFPEESKGLVLGLPPKYTKYVWGWPYRFLKKVADADAKFYLLIDTEEDAMACAEIPVDGIVTDHIEVVGKHYKR